MRYNPRARLDRSQVQVGRGGGGGRGGLGLPIPMGTGGRVGGGIGGLLVLVVILLFSGALGGGGGGTPGVTGAQDTAVEGLPQCETGADANEQRECAILADVNSIQAYWEDALPQQSGRQYAENVTRVFSGSVSTGCGNATSDVGPFYCPTDQTVYLDLSFFDDMLEGQLGARGGAFSEAYVLAHEYGHHVQNLLGTMGRVRTQQGPESDAVRLELQADCYAGMWSKHATEVPDDSGEVFIEELTQDDYARAMDAAAAVGDDRIQERASGRSNPESWTHGSAAARMMWFETGLREGSLEACDTFATDRLYPR